MPKTPPALVAFLLILFLLQPLFSAHAAPFEPKRLVRVGAFSLYPAIFKDDDGQIQGFYVDMFSAIAREENWRIQYVYGSWAEGFERLKTGDVDVLTSVAYTEERSTYMDFCSAPLLTVWGELYVNRDSSIQGIRDVAGKTIAVMKGDFNADSFIRLVKKFDIPCTFVYMDNFDQIFQAVSTGNVDGGVVNNTYGAARHEEFRIKSSGVIFNPFDIYLTVGKGRNGDVLRVLNHTLTLWRQKENSPYYRALDKWGHGNARAVKVMPQWMEETLIALGLVLVIALSFIALLRAQVRRATSQLRKNEESLEETRTRYQTLFENSPVSIWEEDFSEVKSYLSTLPKETWQNAETFIKEHPEVIQACAEKVRILDINQASLNLHEAESKDELLGRLADTFTPESFRDFASELVAIMNGITFLSMEGRVKTLSGRDLHVVLSWRVVPGHEEDLSRVIVSLLDITDRKIARRQIDSLLRSVADGIVMTDRNGRVVLMNMAAEKILETQHFLAEGKPLRQAVTKPSVQEAIARFEQMRSGEETILELPDRDTKQRRIIQASRYSADGENAKASGCILILRDITREHESDRMKSEFMSTAAHELRTPLASIMGFSEFLLEQENLGEKDRQEYLQIINDKAHVLERIITDLLDISRVEAGRLIHLEKQPCHLAPLIEKMVGAYRKEFTNHLFDLNFSDDFRQEVLADIYKIEQVMENLLSNAVKFTPPNRTITIRGETSGEMRHISVQDEGIGMTPEQMARVFDKFYRADASDTATKGFGLGMTIAKGIVEAHGGEIWVQSTLGQGTVVTFSLPGPARV